MASKLDRLQKKGFKVNEAALSKIARGDQEPGGEYSEININDIEENPDNALYRELDTEEDIALLADDIRRAGLLLSLTGLVGSKLSALPIAPRSAKWLSDNMPLKCRLNCRRLFRNLGFRLMAEE